MKKSTFQLIILLIICAALGLVLSRLPAELKEIEEMKKRGQLAPVLDNYTINDEIRAQAELGYRLFRERKFVSESNGGFYTDPVEGGGFEFWANPYWAQFDRDQNGHFETIFQFDGKDSITYFGSIGGDGNYVDVRKGMEPYLGKFKLEPFIVPEGQEHREQSG